MKMTQKLLKTEEIDWDYYDYARELERQWRQSQPRYIDKELLEIYPAVKSIIPDKLAELNGERDTLVKIIKGKLKIIKREVKDEFSQWFWREWIKAKEGQQLLLVDKQISHFNRLQFIASGKSTKNQITDEYLQQALSIPIQDILSSQVKFRKSGRNFVGLCPLHTEKQPSFYIYRESNSCWCFGCQKGGNTINLVRLLYGYSFKEAINYLLGVM